MNRYNSILDIKLRDFVITPYIDGVMCDDIGFTRIAGSTAISEAERKLEKNLNIKETAYDLYSKMQCFKEKNKILYHSFIDIDEKNNLMIQYDFCFSIDEILLLARKTNLKYENLQYTWFTNTYNAINYLIDDKNLYICIKDGYGAASNIGILTLLISFANLSYENFKCDKFNTERIKEDVLIEYIMR